MPLREYKCPSCSLLDEHLINGEPPDTRACKRCGAAAELKRIPSSIALARSGMDNAPLDNFIGKDSEQKWDLLHARQQARTTARVEANTQGLTAVGLGKTGAEKYQPIAQAQKVQRTQLTKTIERAGYGKTLKVPGSN
jgi:hypothetical protein